MKKIAIIITIGILLVGICTAEELLVSDTLKKIKQQAIALYSIQSEHINTNEVLEATQNLKEFWAKREPQLCFFINYKDMGELSNEIIKADSYAKENIKEEFLTSVALIIYYCETFNHITGINMQNIF